MGSRSEAVEYEKFPKVYRCKHYPKRTITFRDREHFGVNEDGTQSKYGLDDIENCADFELVRPAPDAEKTRRDIEEVHRMMDDEERSR